MNRSCPACGTLRQEATRECPTCSVPLKEDASQGLVQAILDRDRKAAKKEQEKSAIAGFAVAFVAFELFATFGLHLPSSGGFDFPRMAGAGLCGALGGAIGSWVGRPKARK